MTGSCVPDNHRATPTINFIHFCQRKAFEELQSHLRVCHETIYQSIYTHGHYLDMLRQDLPQARPKRRKKGQGKRRRGPSIPDRVDIRERPAVVDERKEIGHWEGDTVAGKNQDGFAVTLVECTSRQVAAAKTQTKAALEV